MQTDGQTDRQADDEHSANSGVGTNLGVESRHSIDFFCEMRRINCNV